MYFQDLGERSKSSAAVSEAINAIAWVQRLAGVEPVSQNQLVKSVSEGFQAKPKKKKEPITTEMLEKWVT